MMPSICEMLSGGMLEYTAGFAKSAGYDYSIGRRDANCVTARTDADEAAASAFDRVDIGLWDFEKRRLR